MELRTLSYFLAVAREGSILGAANTLHLTQPNLSRQMKELELEVGKQLFIRSNRNITLTEDGILLRKRADEILTLVKKTESELAKRDLHKCCVVVPGIRPIQHRKPANDLVFRQ